MIGTNYLPEGENVRHRASKLKDHKIGRSPYFEETKSGDFFTGNFQGAS